MNRRNSAPTRLALIARAKRYEVSQDDYQYRRIAHIQQKPAPAACSLPHLVAALWLDSSYPFPADRYLICTLQPGADRFQQNGPGQRLGDNSLGLDREGVGKCFGVVAWNQKQDRDQRRAQTRAYRSSQGEGTSGVHICRNHQQVGRFYPRRLQRGADIVESQDAELLRFQM